MLRQSSRFLALWLALAPMAWAADVDLSDKPLASGTSGEVKPNVMIILDDSGSMSFSYLPDDAVKFHGKYGYVSSQCNGVYYNPDVVYRPPIDASGNAYPDADFNAARDDGFDSGSTARNLDSQFMANRFSPESANTAYNSSSYKPYKNSALGPSGAYYYVYSGSQTKKDYTNTNSAFYKECNSSFESTPGANVFAKRRLAPAMTTTIDATCSGSCGSNNNVTSIKVGTVELMSSSTGNASSIGTMANTIRDRINAKTATTGFSATASSGTVTITGPASAANLTPVIVKSGNGSMTFAADVFPETDAAKLTNFANWYSYYRVRLLAAKTAMGHALGSLSEPSNYRIGYSTHSYTGTDSNSTSFQAIDDFCGPAPGCDQRTKVYAKLYGAGANGGTPLRPALSKIGRIYAGKLGDDPVQYSCQQNFTILTTDGFWNGGSGYQLNGSSNVGNQDGSAQRPMWDGATTKQVDTYQRYTYSLSNCSGGRQSVKRQEQRMKVTTPIEPSGSPVSEAWTNYGSATNYISCTKPAPALPNPNPTDPVLISSTTTTTGGTSDTLADVAMYYYQTDLRTSALGNCTGATVDGKTYDVCENNVPGSGTDKASHQHMTTFTLGLGISGELEYCENYDSGACADFEAIKQGTRIWPTPTADDLTTVDDLWHAAVNGRGKYFSAKSPESLSKGVQKALAGVSARTASAAAAATSNLEPVAGDNYAYVAMYTTVDWDGDITAREIDLAAGTVSDTPIWSAQAKLDTKVSASSDTRHVYFNGGGTLKEFTPANLATQKAANGFAPGPDNPNGQLTQYAALTAAEQAQATQDSIINYLRGQTQHEDEGTNAWPLYRDRKHALGDIVNGAPVYVRKPPFAYSDDNYAQFVELKKNRKSVVYAGANDGMLHAFDGDTGDELWAYIPTAVIPDLYKLADKSYPTNHRFYVDGPIVVGDVCPATTCNANQWKTILVGGLGKGGRAYYALDVTDPASPKLLWEFADDNLGYSYGNAILTKVSGQWAVIVASGYNNNVSPGDGKGRLFVLKASDGSKLAEIVTDNTVTDPSKSGIAKINNWVSNTSLDNSTQHVYGGDLDGNVWRFDVVAKTATKITTIGKTKGAPTQPITTKPELAEVKIGGSQKRVILVGSGKYLGTSDVGSTQLMSLYAIKDDLISPPYGNFRDNTAAVVHDLSGDSGSRQLSYTAMSADKIGWYIDLDAKSGERVNVDPKYQLGWWVVPSNIPTPNVCNIGGTSWLYFIDPWTGRTRVADTGWAVNVGNTLIVGINIVKLPSGKTVTIVTTSDAKYPVFGNPMAPFGANVRRLNWRELTR
ncbi:MAG TPA: PilC/PilY family type IV pilus protein [Burkholderiaceae bacterium]|nr:PilC/PilY family type IV pilus protein [Burkholderiaceae bacterium]